jgi:Lipid A disaccharide synthetase
MEKALKQAGIPTVHYVSPSVWAWKRKRIFKIKQSTDLLLTLFPFEAEVYRPTGQNLRFVGHPLADQIPAELDLAAAREQYDRNRTDQGPLIALLPGSRGSELKYLAGPFLETARWLARQRPELEFILPAANQRRYEQLAQLVQQYPELKLFKTVGTAAVGALRFPCYEIVFTSSAVYSLHLLFFWGDLRSLFYHIRYN